MLCLPLCEIIYVIQGELVLLPLLRYLRNNGFYFQEKSGFVPTYLLFSWLVDCYEGAGVKAGEIIVPINYFSLVELL